MDRLFNVNNPLMRALSKLFDIGWLSLIYVVFCVPLVTIGAATTSLYYVSAKVLRKDRGYVWSEFWHSFKLNFKPATLMWLIFAAIYGLLYFNLTTFNTSNAAGGYLVGAYIALAFIVTCVASYAFCLLSRFNMNVKRDSALCIVYVIPPLPSHIVLFGNFICGRIWNLCRIPCAVADFFVVCTGTGIFSIYVPDGAFIEKIYAKAGKTLYGKWRRNRRMV